MFKKIVDWFNEPEANSKPSISINLAAAALLVEVMAADDEWDSAEEDTIKQLIKSTLELSKTETDELMEAAKQHHNAAHDLFEITKKVNEHFTPEEKFKLVKGMWMVAFADGNVDRYEDHIIRRVAELLYVPHNQFIKAKLEAEPQ